MPALPNLTPLRPLSLSLSLSLPRRLKLETQDLHAATERTGAMAEMLAGRLPHAGYLALLRNLHTVYAALEDGLQGPQAHAAARRVDDSALHRAAALAADLQSLHGPLWRGEIPALPAALAYAARLQQLAKDGSAALVAHVYARYLGDLHGGQILKRLVWRSYGDTTATAFYEFGDEARVLALRQSLRQALSDLPITAVEVDAIVAEARWAFLQHQHLFQELASV